MSLDIVADYFGEDLPETESAPTGKPKRPPLPGLPKLSMIPAAQIQHFDNGLNPGKGRSQHTIKIELYLREWGIDLKNNDWARTVALMTPKQVIRYAEDEFEAGRIAEDLHGMYLDVAAKAKEMEEGVEWVKIGIVEDARANIRYHGEMLIVQSHPDEPVWKMTVHVLKDGEIIEVKLKVPGTRPGLVRRENAAIYTGLYDPRKILLKQLHVEQAKRVGLSYGDYMRQRGIAPY